MYFDTVVVAALTIITATICVSIFGVSFLMNRIAADAAKAKQDS